MKPDKGLGLDMLPFPAAVILLQAFYHVLVDKKSCGGRTKALRHGNRSWDGEPGKYLQAVPSQAAYCGVAEQNRSRGGEELLWRMLIC